MGLFGRNRQVEQNPAYTAKSALHPRADSHTSSFDNKQKLSQSMTEPLYEVRHLESVRRYAPAPAPSYHGPHFEKGPSQEEIWNTRQTKEPWQFDKKVDEVAFRQEYCHRAPTFQQPVQEHQYSAPYEVRPIPWTKQMSAEYDEYKILDGSNKVNRAGVREANKTKVGRNYVPTEDHGRAIEEGISYAIAGRTMAKMRPHKLAQASITNTRKHMRNEAHKPTKRKWQRPNKTQRDTEMMRRSLSHCTVDGRYKCHHS